MDNGDQLASDARRIVAELTGDDVVQVQKIELGVMAYKYAVLSGRGQMYVARFYPATRESVVRYEPDLVERCRDLGMRVPEVVGNSKSGPKAALEYMVYKMLRGRSMQERFASLTDDALQKISRELIIELRLLGKAPIAGFGGLVDAEHGRFGSWMSFIKEVFAEGIEAGRQSPSFSTGLIEGIEVIGERLEKFSYAGPPSLCWGDISPDNVILDENDELAGLVDFEGVVGAELQLNHGYLRARFAGTRFWSAFDREWHSHAGFESARSALYVIVRALRILRYAREPLPTGVQRLPIADFLPGLHGAVEEGLSWANARSVPIG